MQYKFDYKPLSDKEIVDMIITKPYNEEAAAYIIRDRYDALLTKLYYKIYDARKIWYEDCLDDMFCYLKGSKLDWQKLRAFQWRCKFPSWFKITARNRFLYIKPYLEGRITGTITIDDDENDNPVQLPDMSREYYELQQLKIMLLEAISLLDNPEQKFVILKRLQGFNSIEIADLMRQSWEKHGIMKFDNRGNPIVPTAGYVDVHTQRAKENLKKIIVNLF